MNVIRIHQMEFNANHGYYSEEKKMSQKFMINLDIHTDFSIAATEDKLEGTINYEEIYTICEKIMKKPVALIEHIAFKIGTAIKSKYTSIKSLKIEVQKRDVQLGGKLEYVSVIIEI